jgi:molybdopterin converting factor small subunit
MVRVKVEFWARSGSGKEWGPEFEFPADKRAALNLCVKDGTTVRALFEDLERYPAIKSEVFSGRNFRPEINLALNSLVMGHDELYDRVLTDGDRISVLPMYVGG